MFCICYGHGDSSSGWYSGDLFMMMLLLCGHWALCGSFAQALYKGHMCGGGCLTNALPGQFVKVKSHKKTRQAALLRSDNNATQSRCPLCTDTVGNYWSRVEKLIPNRTRRTDLLRYKGKKKICGPIIITKLLKHDQDVFILVKTACASFKKW